MGRIRFLAGLPHLIPFEEVAQPVWRLPAGVRTAAIALSLVGIVGGVRGLDAQISNQGSELQSSNAPAAAPAVPSSSEAVDLAPTALVVDRIPAGDTHRFLMVTMTAYTSGAAGSDEEPQMTASSRRARPGTVALSRDLLRSFTPSAPFEFGDRVLVPGMGVYVVEDAMNPRWTRKADIWFEDAQTARRWGIRTVYLTRIDAGEPLIVSHEFPE